MIGGLKDYHVSAQFYSTESATLPIQVKTADGQTVIMGVDRTKISKADFPFDQGDVIVSINSQPVANVLKGLMPPVINHESTDAAIADLSLFARSGRKAQAVPKGRVLIEAPKKGRNQNHHVQSLLVLHQRIF